MGLQLDGRIKAGNDLLDGDLRDLAIVSGANGTFLYAGTGQNGGISVYRITGAGGAAGGLASLSDSLYFTTSGITMGGLDVVSLDGEDRLFVTGTGIGALTGYGITDDGDLTKLVHSDLPGKGVETAMALAGTPLNSGKSALYMVDGDTGLLKAYVSSGTGGLTSAAALNGKAIPATGVLPFDLPGAVGLEVVRIGSASFLLAGETGYGGVRSYRIDAASGALSYVDSLGAEDGLGVDSPSALQTVRAHGATWVILAGAGSGSLSVMKLAANGALSLADHILDTLPTRFGGVAALEVVQVGGHVFVLAGGADDGLALFSLLPGGHLVHMQSLAHTRGAGLENITGIEAVQVGGEIRIFVTSGADPGLSQFSLSLDDLGAVIQTASAAGQMRGTAAGDLILGAGANNRLIGEAGDDILVAAHSGGVLSGGAGADIFVLCPTAGTLRITDFEAGLDRLDLTRFPMLRSIDQLTLTPTSDGIKVGFGTTQITLQSQDGKPLKAQDLWPGGFDTPDRALIPPGPVIRVTQGSGRDDTLIRGAGLDTIWGMGGNDLIRAGGGSDRLYGGAGADRLFGEAGNDFLNGGTGGDQLTGGAGNDTLKGETGNDTLWGDAGDDRLYGGADDDRLYGGDGNDTLNGEAGNDTLKGDAGNDALWGELGDDQLYGGDGKDSLGGGAGNDKLKGGDDTDRLWGNTGKDALWGQDGHDRIYGGDGNDQLYGGAGRDILKGGKGRDTLKGAAGDDILKGGKDGDILNGGADDDRLKGQGGKDKLVGETGRDTLFGGTGRDTLAGGDGRDRLEGGAGKDVLKGGDQADRLQGGKGGDKLFGGTGDDTLTGGSGRDVFIFSTDKGADKKTGPGDDRITDFTPDMDHIRINIAGIRFKDLTLTRKGGDTVIETGAATGHDTIILTDVRPGELSADDFLFS